MLELVVALAVFMLGMATISVLYLQSLHVQRNSLERVQASQYALEGLEAARAIRDNSYSDLPTGTKGLLIENGVWKFSGTSDTFDGYTRQITLTSLNADSHFVTSTVSWFDGSNVHSIAYGTLFTNWHKPPPSWANPAIVSTTTLFGGVPATAVAALGNNLYIATEEEGECELYAYDITDKAEPVFVDEIDIGNTCSMIDATGTRAYVASDNNPDEVKIIDIADPAHLLEIGSVKLTSNTIITSVAANGTILHLVRGKQGNQSTYYIFDTTNPANPIELGSMNTGAGLFDLALDFATPPFTFLVGDHSTQEFQTVNTSNPGNMGIAGNVNLPGSEDATAVAVSGTQAYVGSDTRGGSPEFYVVHVSNPVRPSEQGSVEIGAKINRIRLSHSYAYLATASSTSEFIVIDVSNALSPAIYGRMDLPGTATGMAFSGDTLYITTDAPGAGLMILQAGY